VMNILLIQLKRIGDLIFTKPAIAALPVLVLEALAPLAVVPAPAAICYGLSGRSAK
jgi:hypothetical protein